MCCGYGARLDSHKNYFWPPLSEFSGSTPGKHCQIKYIAFPVALPKNLGIFDPKSRVLTIL